MIITINIQLILHNFILVIIIITNTINLSRFYTNVNNYYFTPFPKKIKIIILYHEINFILI